DNTLEFRTNRLDTFFVTDKAITDGTVVSGSEVENDEISSTPEADKNNPGTGASDMINAAVMAAIASMTAAGLAIYKKNEK
ncbi:MAG: hypothetical protein HFG20_04815, partial [Anaerotruncus sp.]|nr:hypothetical protein [Anaerotruncus sp.]